MSLDLPMMKKLLQAMHADAEEAYKVACSARNAVDAMNAPEHWRKLHSLALLHYELCAGLENAIEATLELTRRAKSGGEP